MGKIASAVKIITDLPLSKLFLPLLLIGLMLIVVGRYVGKTTKTTETQTSEYVINHTEQEERLSGILSEIEGAGEVEVMITTKDKTSSVVVIATGADEPIVRLKLRQAVRTAVQTDDKNIKIIKKQS